MDYQRQLLAELMNPLIPVAKKDFRDPEFCKHHLAGFCPFEIFMNTKVSLWSRRERVCLVERERSEVWLEIALELAFDLPGIPVFRPGIGKELSLCGSSLRPLCGTEISKNLSDPSIIASRIYPT